jgi:hypothetical protein
MSYNSCSEQRFDYSLARSIEANNDDREFFLPVFHMFDIFSGEYRIVAYLVRCSCRPLSRWYMGAFLKQLQVPNLNRNSFRLNFDMGYTSYYAFGLPTFLVIIIALYILFTGAPVL